MDYFSPLPEPPGPIAIVLPARLLWDKGVGTFVEAAQLLRLKTGARFALVGAPDPGNPGTVDRATLERWVKEGAVEWWGWQVEMKNAYSRCHIVALPSAYGEGVPTVLLEAAACGRPVVASNIPGCRRVVVEGETGLLVPPGDAPALAAALARLVQDGAMRKRMGEAGRRVAVERFTDSKINSATLQVYQHLLGRGA